MSDSETEAVSLFISITAADVGTAVELLEATNYQVEQAVNIFFTRGIANAALPSLSDANLAQQIAREDAGSRASASGPASDEVRAPIPSKRDRLYGDLIFQPQGQPNHVGSSHEIDAFRDFKAEGNGLKSRREAAPKLPGRLGDMFQPPTDLIYKGTFEDATSEALNNSKWLLLNIQSNTEFASHQLNRDTWGDDVIKNLLPASFVFLQFQSASGEGQRLQNLYQLDELPAIAVIHPDTGLAMLRLVGFRNAERLLEDLEKFLDRPPNDPEAYKIGVALRHKRRLRENPMSQAQVEDEELAAAIALSMSESQPQAAEEQTPSLITDRESDDSPSSLAGPSTNPRAEQVPEDSAKDAAEVQAEALAALPSEAEAAGAAGARIRVRLPDGTTHTRSFPRSATLEVLRTFCQAFCLEAAGGRKFRIALAGRGGPSETLSDMEQTLEQAGLANSVVQITWN